MVQVVSRSGDVACAWSVQMRAVPADVRGGFPVRQTWAETADAQEAFLAYLSDRERRRRHNGRMATVLVVLAILAEAYVFWRWLV
jgi:hypothetical protein